MSQPRADHNLVTDPPPFSLDHSRTVDLIVCRHVTIYFSRSTTRALVERFHRALVPDGWLLMGPAESLWQVSDVFALQPVGDAFAYRAATERRPVRTSSTVPAQRSMAPAARALPPAAVPRRPRHDPRALPLRVPTRAGVPAGSVLAASPDVRAAALSSAQAAFDTGDYEAAALGAVKVLDADPVSSEAYVLLGHARLNAGDLEGAVQPLQKAVYLEPLAGHAHFLLAVALSAVQRPQQAAPSYRAAADTLPGVPAEALRRMLDGRQLQELVQLCRRLADAAEAGTDPIRRGA